LGTALAVGEAWLLAHGLSTAEFHSRSGHLILRSDHPIEYWTYAGLLGGALICTVPMALGLAYSLLRINAQNKAMDSLLARRAATREPRVAGTTTGSEKGKCR